MKPLFTIITKTFLEKDEQEQVEKIESLCEMTDYYFWLYFEH